MKLFFVFFIYFLFLQRCSCTKKVPVPFNQTDPPNPRYNNPGNIKDRSKETQKIFEKLSYDRPYLGEKWKDRFVKPFKPAYKHYCDNLLCAEYTTAACGLNRETMHFRWFQSKCHIALNNLCARYRGQRRYDTIEEKFCRMYVLYVRTTCPVSCDNVFEPICAVSTYDGHVVLFKNECFLDHANCQKESFKEYESVTIDLCREYYISRAIGNDTI